MLSIKTYVHKNGKWYCEEVKPTDYNKHYIEFREFNEEKLQFLSGEERLYGFVDIQFEARLASGEIEMRFGKLPGSRERMKVLEQEAREKGFVLIAAKAAETLRLYS